MNIKSKGLDLTLITFMMGLALLSGKKLFFERFEGQLHQGEVIAQISEQLNTVKVKNDGLISWLDAHVGDNLYNNDQIYTYNNSQVDVSFSEGEKFTLSENTLFKISKSEETTKLSLEKGMAKASLSKGQAPIELVIKGKVYSLQGDNAQMQISHIKGQSEISLESGNAHIEIGTEKMRLNNAEVLKVDSTGKSSIKKMRLIPEYPNIAQKIYFKEEKKIEFKWKNLLDSKNVELIISNDQELEMPFFSKSLDLNSVEVDFKNEGIYYWKIVSKEKNESAPLRTFKLVKIYPPKWISPLPGSILNFKKTVDKDLSMESVLLKWEHSEAQSYILEILFPDKSKKSLKLLENKYFLNGLVPGLYQFRVKGESDQFGSTDWSLVTNLKIEVTDLPEAINLLYPEKHTKSTVYQAQGQEVSFSWKPGPGVDGYEIFIMKDSPNGDVIHQEKVRTSFYTWKLNQFGDFYWKVRAIDSLGRETPFSDVWPFSIALEEVNTLFPESGTKVELKRPNQSVKFEWTKEGRGKVSYLFELSESEDFSKILHSERVHGEFAEVSFEKIGTYFWRTKIIGPNNEVLYSKPFKVTVEPTPPPQQPILPPEKKLEIKIKKIESSSILEKAFKIIIDFVFPEVQAQSFEKYVLIEWEEDENAKEYHLEIYKDKDLTNLLVKETLQRPQFEWQNPQEGTYYWRIAVKDYWDRLGPFSETSILNIFLSQELKDLAPPELLSPIHKYDGKKGDKLKFHWSGDSRVKDYILEVSRDLDFKNVLLKKKTSRDHLSIKVNIEGVLYWRITSFDRFKRKSISKRRSIILEEDQRDVISSKITKKQLNKEFAVSLSPTKVSFEQKANNYSAKIDGTALASFSALVVMPLVNNWILNLNFKRQSGEVFETLNYVSHFFTFSGSKEVWKNISIGALLALQHQSSYSLTTRQTLQDGSDFVWSLGPRLIYHHDFSPKIKFNAKFDLALGAMTYYGLSLNGYYKLKEKIFFLLSPFYEGKSFDSESSKISMSEMGISFGLGLYF